MRDTFKVTSYEQSEKTRKKEKKKTVEQPTLLA